MLNLHTPLGPCYIVETVRDLPDLRGNHRLYIDVETTAFADNISDCDPFLGHKICGLSVCTEDSEGGWYVPVRHTQGSNIPEDAFRSWLGDLIKDLPEWANHNTRFDINFVVTGEKLPIYQGRIIDTLTTAKMIDSDRMRFGLKPLSQDWLSIDMDESKEVEAWLKGIKSKNYARVPIDLLGRYAVMDVLSCRALSKYIMDRFPSDMTDLLETETKLSSVLLDMEQQGLRVDKQQLVVESVKSLRKIVLLQDRISTLIGREYVDSNKVLFDLLCVQSGLPILEFNEKGNASFDADALTQYRIHPSVLINPDLKELVDLIVEHRAEAHFKSLFLDSYRELVDDNSRIHPRYNQIIRTGRMSGNSPNIMQLNKRAKGLILCDEGKSFLCCDASQMEFRLIIHYIQDEKTIKAYRENPKTDIHQWVADLCGIDRPAAKTVNFGVAYGAGKKKVTGELAKNSTIINLIGSEISQLIADGKLNHSERDSKYRRLCEERASNVYDTYHKTFPGIKLMSERAQIQCLQRGYVFNAFRRRRHLPQMFARKAFNSIIQGGAMDYIKDRMVALSSRFNPAMKSAGISICANVHDELVFTGPSEALHDPKIRTLIVNTLQHQTIPFRVPFIWDASISDSSWAEAK